MNNKFTFTLSVLLGFSLITNAQDPHLSQFFASPLTVNPALTGKFDGKYRLAANYKTQWHAYNDIYSSFTSSLDFSILKDRLPENDILGVGIVALNEKGGGGALTNNYLGISTSYHKSLDEDGFKKIGVGVEGVYGQKRLDNNNFSSIDQFSAFGFTGLTKQTFKDENTININYFDLNAGILFSSSTDQSNNFYVGASMYHINSPKKSFNGAEWKVAPRTTVNAGGYFPLSESVTLHTNAIYQYQQGTNETVVGGALSSALDSRDGEPSNIFGGLWYRINNAIIPYAGIEFSGLRIGASYDISTIKVQPGMERRSSMELSLIYIKRTPGNQSLSCPQF
jgi:type IX secretion system PorP/SprF family membrane protein